jgi:hypothetical protein
MVKRILLVGAVFLAFVPGMILPATQTNAQVPKELVVQYQLGPRDGSSVLIAPDTTTGSTVRKRNACWIQLEDRYGMLPESQNGQQNPPRRSIYRSF